MAINKPIATEAVFSVDVAIFWNSRAAQKFIEEDT
jgi:hypothetical protein